MSIGNRIKKHREKAGLSQKELGEKLGVSQQHIAQYENEKRIPKMETLRKLSNALNVYTYDLLYDENTAEEKKQQDIAEIAIKLINDGNLELPNNDISNVILLRNFNRLNNLGKKEAFKRVEELTEIQKYTEPNN